MRVDTMVAIEFAVSCKPLRKSNASATTIKPIRTGRLSSVVMALRRSNLIDDDRVYFVRDVLEAIDNFLQMIVELRADDEFHDIVLPIGDVLLIGDKKRLDALIADLIGMLFDGDDL